MSAGQQAILLAGAGAATALGASLPCVAAAVRAGISAYREHPFMRDRHGARMIVARADWLDPVMPLPERLSALTALAAAEALSPLAGAPAAARLRVHLAVARGLDADCVQSVSRGFQEASAPAGNAVSLVAEGHAAGLLALENAVSDLHSGRARVCLVGGVDSHLTADLLEAIDYGGRLRSRDHSWGFTPGEGAGFCLLTTGANAASLGLVPQMLVEAVATAHEENVLGRRAVNVGTALSAVFRAVLPAGTRVAHSYADLNGEIYRADEFAFAMARTSDRFQDDASFTAAAELWGDVGAASAPLAIALAAGTWARGYGRGPTALVWGSSADSPLRGAARIRHVITPEPWWSMP